MPVSFPPCLAWPSPFCCKRQFFGDIPKGPQWCLGKVSGDRKHSDIYEKEIRFTVKSSEVMSLEITVMSPEMPSYVGRNFIMPQQYPSRLQNSRFFSQNQ